MNTSAHRGRECMEEQPAAGVQLGGSRTAKRKGQKQGVSYCFLPAPPCTVHHLPGVNSTESLSGLEHCLERSPRGLTSGNALTDASRCVLYHRWIAAAKMKFDPVVTSD
ncbi:hypothetical protein U0070_009525 [Myodes glareolus]|uniref:Uncharacterized protein n=1 Tax=Myodes glareolus TaxID=447135 RepID=A0AAW0H903_MYOGA